jgi:hypothetical protein
MSNLKKVLLLKSNLKKVLLRNPILFPMVRLTDWQMAMQMAKHSVKPRLMGFETGLLTDWRMARLTDWQMAMQMAKHLVKPRLMGSGKDLMMDLQKD